MDAMCSFFPLICVVSSKLDSPKSRNELQVAILERVMKQVDVKQNFQFFLNAYKNDASELKKQFNKLQNNLKSSPISAPATPMTPNGDYGAITKSHSLKKAQQIIQQTPESAISLFQSIFRQSLTAGSEIKLCMDSMVRDPINCHAPPLSRIEVRKIIATNSRPYLVDLYVANRSDNFEYLSSTVILKKGDDLRRDSAVLHVFRLMNKIWRENGLEFTQV